LLNKKVEITFFISKKTPKTTKNHPKPPIFRPKTHFFKSKTPQKPQKTPPKPPKITKKPQNTYKIHIKTALTLARPRPPHAARPAASPDRLLWVKMGVFGVRIVRKTHFGARKCEKMGRNARF
jgi:hypothetical protein